MMTEEIRNLLIAYLRTLDITSSMDAYEVRDKIGETEDTPVGKITVYDGSSKICFVLKKYPFVIKWTEGATFDEAKKEVQIYQDAQKAHLDFFFPKTEFLCEINGIYFVVQEKIDCNAHEARNNEALQKAIRRITKTPTVHIYQKIQTAFNKAGRQYRRELNQDWAKMAISLYGKKACKDLCEFVIKHHINDLHSFNIGYKNSRPIILDFSGYHR